MGWTIGMPSLKLNNAGAKSKHCGSFADVSAEALEERQGHDPDIDPALAAKNVYEGYRSAAELVAYSEAHCNTLRDAAGRGIRKDAVRMCATIIKPPAAMMAGLTEDEQMRFLRDGVAKLREIVGPGNVKSIAYHFDELGAHVHVFWEPMTDDGRLCAKEMHNLHFFSRLNREMPEYMRSKGWDIDDCNAYDMAAEKLKNEKEKNERRQKNGRSSAVYKAQAQLELNRLNATIDDRLNCMETNLQQFADEMVDSVVGSPGVFDNVVFLMTNCSDARFDELDEEGRELRRAFLRDVVDENLDDLQNTIKQANVASNQHLTWANRQELWARYRATSDDFWRMRNALNEQYKLWLSDAYERQGDLLHEYYQAMYMLRRSRTILGVIYHTIEALMYLSKRRRVDEIIDAVKYERKQLAENTASFGRFSRAYREDLLAGKMPGEDYLKALEELVQHLDREEQVFQQEQNQHQIEDPDIER